MGKRRATQFRSPWDVIHPGRQFTEKLAQSPLTTDLLTQRIENYFAGWKLAADPKVVAEQLAEEQAEAEEASDKA